MSRSGCLSDGAGLSDFSNALADSLKPLNPAAAWEKELQHPFVPLQDSHIELELAWLRNVIDPFMHASSTKLNIYG